MTDLEKTERQFLNLGYSTVKRKSSLNFSLEVYNQDEDLPEFTLFFDLNGKLV